MDYGQYIIDIFESFVIPGAFGGFGIAFAIYLICLGISNGYKLISSFSDYEEI